MNLINNNLLEQETFTPFNFAKDFQDVCDENDLDGISAGKYLLLKSYPDDFLKILMHDSKLCYIYPEEISVHPDSSLIPHGIYPAKCLTRNTLTQSKYSIRKDYNFFCLTILKKEYYWLQQFLNWTHHYLETRVAFGEVLTKHEAIRLALSEVVENMAIARVILEKKQLVKDIRKSFSIFVLKAIKTLANCTGGRGFAGGNILEFYYITQLVNHFLCQ